MYLSSSPKKSYTSLASLSVGRDEADRYAALLAEDAKRNTVYAVETLMTIWTSLLGRGAICAPHRNIYPSLAECDVCIREFGKNPSERSDALAEVAEAVRLVESSRTFVSVMPEVSVNIACTSGESESLEDIAAVPGRIVKVRGSPKAMLPPALGASRHMAGMLLLVRKRRKDVRAAINLRYDSKVASVLKSLHLKPLFIGGYPPAEGGDATLEALRSRLLTSKEEFDAIVDKGSRGIEPNVYLFGKDARDLAKLAIKISEKYSLS